LPLEAVKQTILLIHPYDLVEIYQNFYQPVIRMKEKISLTFVDVRLRRKCHFAQARTPLDRLFDMDALNESTQLSLINPQKIDQTPSTS